jgi:hypothetical protein
MRSIAIVSGYLVRCPLAGYAWQALQYLAGLRALGFDPFFYEDTAYFADCWNPASGEIGPPGPAAMDFTARFFAAHGFADRWIFWDAQRDRWHGVGAEQARDALATARLVVGLAAVNRLPCDLGALAARPPARLFIDLDPGVTQIRAERDAGLRQLLDEYDAHFSVGENVGRADCAIPSGGRAWQATRQPIALELWPGLAPPAGAALTTIGRWDDRRPGLELDGTIYGWSKREEWLRFVELPRVTQTRCTIAMDVEKVAGDREMLERHGWQVADPLAVSLDPDGYRDFIRRSLGEFTVAKDLNVRLATGWFSDRSACYLAAGRPVIVQDTGFRRTLPTGAGILAFRTVDEASQAVHTVVTDWTLHSAAARRVAEQYFKASWVLADLLDRAGV